MAMTDMSEPGANERQLPRVVAEFSRENHLLGFSLRNHFLKTAVVCILLLTGSLYMTSGAGVGEWLLFFLFLLVANFVEWGFHRYPMHRPMHFPPGIRMLYMNHTLIHHRAFLHNSMPLRDTRELGLVLMPWYTMLLVMALGLPVAFLGWWLGGHAVFGIFYVMALCYYLAYEVLHALYHTTDETQCRLGLKDNRLFQFLRAHHAHHHRLDRMSKVNFNVTFPLADTVMGTREQPDLSADAVSAAETWEKNMNKKERDSLELSDL